MANEEHLAILKQGVDVWNKWREEHTEVKPQLLDADLSQAHLSAADLSYADLRAALLSGANLHKAYLKGADLSAALLIGADLSEADLSIVDLSIVKLSGALLCHAYLGRARFSGADISSVDLSGATLHWTNFDDVDLSKVMGLDSVIHHGPSFIDIRTIYKSQGHIPEAFLRGAGVPDTFITFMKSLTGVALDFYSCFISYSSKDQAFVERLYADLQAKGVRCWYAPEDLKIGEPILAGIDKGIRLHDKLLLVLSEHSVASRWVEHEVEVALAEELRPDRKTKVLFPISLDTAVMDAKVDWAYRIRQRHIGAFIHWKNHDAYQRAFDRLLRDLKAEA